MLGGAPASNGRSQRLIPLMPPRRSGRMMRRHLSALAPIQSNDGADDMGGVSETQTPVSVVGEYEAQSCRLWVLEVLIQLRMAAPLTAGLVLNYMTTLVTLSIVGGEGTDALAAAGFATALSSCTGKTVLMGLCGALDTLSAQAAGAGRLDLLGPVCRNCQRFLLWHAVPVALFFLSSELWLPHIMEPKTGRLAAHYLLISMIDLFFQAIWRPVNRVLASQRVTMPQMVVCALVLPIHWVLSVQLVKSFGTLGAAYAAAASSFVTLVLMYVATSVVGLWHTVCGGSATARELDSAGLGRRMMVALAYPSAIMRILESWGFTGMVVASCLLPDSRLEIDVMSLSMNIYNLCFMAFAALGICADSRVGNSLGEGKPLSAKRGIWVALTLVWPAAALMSAAMVVPVSFRWIAARLHVGSLDAAVESQLQDILRIVAAITLVDGLQTALAGGVRGAGRQVQGAKICILSYWAVGIPCALILAFPCRLGSRGLWLGMGVGPTVQMLLYARLLWQLDWEALADESSSRLMARTMRSQASCDSSSTA